MPESWRTRLERWGFNFFPTYRSTGAWITYIAADYREIRIRLPLGWRTRNYVGTMFGGSMYAAGDGVFMVMLIKALGKDYIVWDKAATVRFRKPARATLYGRFVLSPEELDDIRRGTASGEAVERAHRVQLTAKDGTVHAEIEWLIHIHRRDTESRSP
jgi:acyl-coenzyme A thioesterase PaaI-like protein